MAEEQNTLIGQRVRAARNAANKTLADIVAGLPEPITVQQLANYERGLSRWPAVLLGEVARIIGVEVIDFYGEPTQ